MKRIVLLSLFVLVLALVGCVEKNVKPVDPNAPQFSVSLADPAWNGKSVPSGQQCLRFGGKNPMTPALSVKNLPPEANGLIMEYSDRTYSPMDRGGHGKIAYLAPAGQKDFSVPSIQAQVKTVPEGFVSISNSKSGGWDTDGAYLPPCSGGKGNSYVIDVWAVKITGDKVEKIGDKVVVKLGYY
ncbi:MAG: hypothetical protein ACOZBL_05135 [Patescibacteria group bacterium]